jgi:hypothetical protein
MLTNVTYFHWKCDKVAPNLFSCDIFLFIVSPHILTPYPLNPKPQPLNEGGGMKFCIS